MSLYLRAFLANFLMGLIVKTSRSNDLSAFAFRCLAIAIAEISAESRLGISPSILDTAPGYFWATFLELEEGGFRVEFKTNIVCDFLSLKSPHFLNVSIALVALFHGFTPVIGSFDVILHLLIAFIHWINDWKCQQIHAHIIVEQLFLLC